MGAREDAGAPEFGASRLGIGKSNSVSACWSRSPAVEQILKDASEGNLCHEPPIKLMDLRAIRS